jgi:hypothetical protein
MILKEIVDLRKSIVSDRINMNEIAKDKAFTHPEVLKISQQLDKKIVKMQKIMHKNLFGTVR